jgi:hypothetical protein
VLFRFVSIVLTKANSDTQQNVIWAFGTIAPGSSSADATLQQHLNSGTFQLDLTGTLSANSTSSPSSTGSSGIPLLYYQKLIVAHAILCVVGFLALVPAGALLARYFRTVSPTWFKGHVTIQAFICKVALWSLLFLQSFIVSIEQLDQL